MSESPEVMSATVLHEPNAADMLDVARTASWLRKLVTGLSPQRPEFIPGLVHVRFVVVKVARDQVFL
jgi:hypothetical protein